MSDKKPTCSDCDHSFELGDDSTTVVCSAHLEYREASHPASCEHFAPRKMLTESSVTEIWSEHSD
ncbi:MAG: hypothetical protein H6943_00370 [Zoogloeaceae bacterium]|nr:hypothetical protein [Zoogloeaceae bacterium]